MGESLERIAEARKAAALKSEFWEAYVAQGAAKEYIVGVGVSDIGTLHKDKKDSAEGERLDELCLVVMLERPLPETLALPDLYKGMKVFYQVTGCIGCN